MQRRARSTLLAATAALSVVSTGCTLPPAAQAPPAPPAPPSKFYVASVDTSSASGASTEEGLKVLDPRAVKALRPGIKVAFFPPDQCRNIAAADTKATPEAAEMANNCGVLVSALETAAADRYSVVSWQTLKGEDPFARAEARHVDIVFEVDSFGMNALGTDASKNMRLDFFEQTNATDRTPLALGGQDLPTVAARCKLGVEQMQVQQAQAGVVGSFTGAIKAVEVSSGQALLYYKRTLTDEGGQQTKSGFDLYFESKGQQAYTPPPPAKVGYNGLQVGGGVMTAVGAFLTGIGIAFTVLANVNDSDFRTPGIATLIPGAIVLGGGIPLLIIGNHKAKKSAVEPAAPGTLGPIYYDAPAQVVCVQPTTPPWLAGPPMAAPEAPVAEGGSSYSFSESQSAGRDAARDRENRLRKLVIDDFTGALGKLGG